MDNRAEISQPASTGRLERGAGVLLVLFWALHLLVMVVRAEFSDKAEQVSFLDNLIRRGSFALFGAFVGYVLYRCLRRLRRREFSRQAVLGAALAFTAACIQAAANAVVFTGDHGRILAGFLYSLLYWFWFYFCWTTAYLALSYSIDVQEQERRAAELTVQAQEAQVRALRYQINPHFLFNTLNAIAALVRDAPSRAEEMIVQLSDFFRRSLAVNPMEDLTLSEEVDLQRLYLEIERTRFPDRLQLDVDLGPGSAEVRIPALLLQPLVENAVKHGVARSTGPTCIRIIAQVDAQTLQITVENNAEASGSQTAGERVGLSNVRDRLRSRFGAAASLETAVIAEGGFRNIVRIPLQR